MTLFCLYALLLLGLAARDARKASTADVFFVNSRSSGALLTGTSILASCVGGSATIGMVGLAWRIGTPAFWWLGSGACGLLVLTLFLAKKIRATDAYTLPEIAGNTLAPAARPLISVIILIAWTAILAAQFSAMGCITASMTGLPPAFSMRLGALLITVYSLMAGQASVIRSDLPQFVLLAAGLLLTLGWLCANNSQPLIAAPLECLNEAFTIRDFWHYLCVLGGSYVICPMLSGRILSSKNASSAVKGSFAAIIGLFLIATIIVGIGLCCRGLVPPECPPDAVLTTIAASLPGWISAFLSLALMSAICSSADSCLITAVTVGCHDVLHRDDTRSCRTTGFVLGICSWLLAEHGHGILELLLMANDVYVCGVVVPVFCGLMLPRRCHPVCAVLAVVSGSAGGIISVFAASAQASLIGMAVSALCILAGALLS